MASAKTFVKWLWSENPHLSDISTSEESVDSMRSLATSTRLCINQRCGEIPVLRVNALAKWLTESLTSRATCSNESSSSRLALTVSRTSLNCHGANPPLTNGPGKC